MNPIEISKKKQVIHLKNGSYDINVVDVMVYDVFNFVFSFDSDTFRVDYFISGSYIDSIYHKIEFFEIVKSFHFMPQAIYLYIFNLLKNGD